MIATYLFITILGAAAGIGIGCAPFARDLEELRHTARRRQANQADSVALHNHHRAVVEWDAYKRNTGWIGD